MNREIKVAARFSLPSGNEVVVTDGVSEPGEVKCRYVRIDGHQADGDGVEIGESCFLSVNFLLERGVRV